MPHGIHIYAKASDMAKENFCAYSQLNHALTHCQCVIQCCDKFTEINLPDKETDDQYSDTSPSVFFTFII